MVSKKRPPRSVSSGVRVAARKANITGSAAALRGPYPPVEPFNSGFLRVSDVHELYFEESGKDRKSVV